MFNRIHSLCVVGALASVAAGCTGFRHAWHARWDRDVCVNAGPTSPSGTVWLDQAPACQPDRLSTLPPPVASTPLAPSEPPVAPALPAPSEPASPSAVPPADPEVAAREALAALGARLTTDASGTLLSIDLAESAATDDTLLHVGRFSRVRQLNLRGTTVTDAGLASLSALADLEFLGLTGTRVTDAGLTDLRHFTRLRFLTLGQTHVTDAGVPALGRMGRLEGLNLKGSQVTPAGTAELRKLLPACKLISPAGDGSDLSNTSRSLTPATPNRTPLSGSSASTSDAAELFDSREERSPAPRPFPRRTGPGDALSPRHLPEDPFLEDDVPQSRRRDDLPPPSTDPQTRLMDILRDKLEDPAVLRAIADVYLSQDRPHDAVPLLAALVERSPTDRELRFRLAVARAKSGDFHTAHADFARIFGAAAADYNIGVLLFEAGQRDASVEWFQRALRTDPQLWQAREWLAVLVPPTPDDRREVTAPLLTDEQIHGLLRELIKTESLHTSPAMGASSPAVGASHESVLR